MTFSFAMSLDTTRSKRWISRLFGRPAWTVRKCGWTDCEVRSPSAEFVLEADSPILMHETIGLPSSEAELLMDEILTILRDGEIANSGEIDNAEGSLLREWSREGS